MTKSLLIRFGWRTVLTLILATHTSSAVILFGSGDPTYNTTPPTGALTNSGWQYEGQWDGFLGTPIAPQYFMAAQHIGGSVGDTFTFGGVNYTTTAYWDDPNTDLRIWKVDGVFPTYAPLYNTNDEAGKTLVVFGRGTQRGTPVAVSQTQTTYSTNVVDLKALGISKKDAQTAFPEATFKGTSMTVVTSDLITNAVIKGWQDGSYDGVTRWGQNKVIGAGGLIVSSFTGTNGPSEAYLSSGDSSGAVFIQNQGVWQLAGINYGIDGPFATDSTSTTFYGAIFDEDGLYVNGTLMPCDGVKRQAFFYATRISPRLAWIQSIITQ